MLCDSSLAKPTSISFTSELDMTDTYWSINHPMIVPGSPGNGRGGARGQQEVQDYEWMLLGAFSEEPQQLSLQGLWQFLLAQTLHLLDSSDRPHKY
jgi:hypothetical protein